MSRALSVVVLTVGLFVAPTSPAPAADAPSPQQQKDIEAAIERLSSADPAERDAASRELWSIGEAAGPALKETAAGDDVEAARRAAEILRQIRYGIRPDTPKPILDLLEQYRQSPPGGDRLAVVPLVTGLTNAGPAGLRVLTRLWKEEADENRRRLMGQALAERARAAASVLLADNEAAAAVEILEAAADVGSPWAEPAARDLAAVLLLRDGGAGLDRRVAALKPLVANDTAEKDARARGARLLAYLCRARGDLASARWAAEQAADPSLRDLLLVESGDWKELASRAAAKADSNASVDDLGFAAAYHRLAGDAAGLDRYVEKIAALAARQPEEAPLAAEALILNDRPEAGMELLLKFKAFDEAAELLAPRMRYDELFALARQVREAGDREASRVEAHAAVAMASLGDDKGAAAVLERLVAETAGKNAGSHDLAHYTLLAESATAIGRADLAEECAARGVAVARPADDVGDLLEAAGFGPGDRAARWWRVLREKYKEPIRITFDRLRSALRGGLAAAQAESLARLAADAARRAESARADAALADIGDTLIATGHKEVAANYFRWLAERPPPARIGLIRLGDLEAGDARWDAAASFYARAWEIDRTQPLPLLLRGKALEKIGRAEEGRGLVALAHLLPMADENVRHALMLELDRRGMADDARRERDLILRTAAFQSWHQSDALRRAGDEAYEKEDFLAAADLWDRAFLDNQSRSTRFARMWANFAMPALIHRARAQGLMRAGDLPAAMREADLALHYAPSDADSVIAFVSELDRLGKKADADAAYAKYVAPYRALCEAHPDSAQAHNQLAWAQAKCRRELDDALKHARRAVELEPKSTACLDTLAETHFQRGEHQQAIETMNRCVELEPADKRHQQQLERFNKALRGEKT
jgi:tetratricopeptide (TPR) repeat protein